MPDYNAHVGEHLRITLLRLLLGLPDYRCNDSVLTDAARGMGFSFPRDRIRTELAWLQEQGLIAMEDLGLDVLLATLTRRGQEVALGHATVPGVKRPGAKG